MAFSDDLITWKIFESIYKNGSIQVTANELNLDKSTVSKKLSALEKHFGRHLFVRDSRPLAPTADAHEIIEFAREIIEGRRKIESYYSSLQDGDSLVIRVMIGNSFRLFIPKLMEPYLARYPNLRFNMIAPIDIDEFLAGKADVMTVNGSVAPKGCIMVPRGRFVFVPCASPDFVKRYGPFNHPRDLANIRTFGNPYPTRYSYAAEHILKFKNETFIFDRREHIHWSNVDIAKESVVEGLGVALSLPLTNVIDELEAGTLVPIMNGWHRPCIGNFLVCKPDDWQIRHIRLFTTWFAKELDKLETRVEKRFSKLFGTKYLNEIVT